MKFRVHKHKISTPPEVEGTVLEYSPAASKTCVNDLAIKAAKLRESGMSCKEAGEQLGIHPTYVSTLSRRANPRLASRRSFGATNQRRRIIAEMVNSGHSFSQIGKALGITRQAVALHAAELRAQQHGETR